ESLVPKSSKKEDFLHHMIYFIWFVVYVHTAGVYVDELLSKLFFTHHRSKNEVNMMVHLESLVPKSSKEENLLYRMIYFIWFVVYVHTAVVYLGQRLSKLLFTHHSIKNEVNMTVYNQSFIWKYSKEENPLF